MYPRNSERSLTTTTADPPLFDAILLLIGSVLSISLPFIAMLASYGGIVLERETGSVRFLLGLPNSRLDAYLGEYLSRAVGASTVNLPTGGSATAAPDSPSTICWGRSAHSGFEASRRHGPDLDCLPSAGRGRAEGPIPIGPGWRRRCRSERGVPTGHSFRSRCVFSTSGWCA